MRFLQAKPPKNAAQNVKFSKATSPSARTWWKQCVTATLPPTATRRKSLSSGRVRAVLWQGRILLSELNSSIFEQKPKHKRRKRVPMTVSLSTVGPKDFAGEPNVPYRVCDTGKPDGACREVLKVFKKARRDASSPVLTKPPGEWEECYF